MLSPIHFFFSETGRGSQQEHHILRSEEFFWKAHRLVSTQQRLRGRSCVSTAIILLLLAVQFLVGMLANLYVMVLSASGAKARLEYFRKGWQERSMERW